MTTLLALFFLFGFAQGDDSEILLKVSGGNLHVELPAKGVTATRQAQTDWLKRAAHAVSQYFSRFPVKDVWISVKNRGSGESIGGTTWSGQKIELRLGQGVDNERLAKDWTATHEMFHLAFPQVEGDFEWMGEGLATYLEPLARARVGDLKADQVWSDMVAGLPRGRPKEGDQGLDQDHTWARTYWGGALFWFEADVQIREKTKNKFSLDSAMRAILNAGGDGSETWSQDKIFKTADKAVGLTVFTDLHQKMGLHSGDVDLDDLWKRLGISKESKVIYDDKAPLAWIRKALVAKVE
jgi:hypothetical protein